MSEREFSIGRLGARTGCKIQTIRYYEQIGLMPEPVRTEGNQRRYGRQHVARLAFIRHGRELGFPLGAIRTLLSFSDDPARPCAEIDRVARIQLRQVESRIARLQGLKAELERMIEECRGGTVASCRIIEVMGDHSLCLSDHVEEMEQVAVGH